MITAKGYSLDANGFYTIPDDCIFYLGDNRGGSEDCSQNGPNLKSRVIGKVDYIAYGNKHIYWQVIKQIFGGGYETKKDWTL